jgi:hypothetical protein
MRGGGSGLDLGVARGYSGIRGEQVRFGKNRFELSAEYPGRAALSVETAWSSVAVRAGVTADVSVANPDEPAND